MRKSTFALIAAVMGMIACLCCCTRGNKTETGEAEQTVDSLPLLGFWEEDFRKEEGVVKNGETFTGLMTRLGMESKDAYMISQLCDSVFDVRKMRAGNTVSAYYDSLTNALNYIVYNDDKVRRTIFRCTDSMAVWTAEKTINHSRKYADVAISSSLWNDMRAAGGSPLLILKLSDIYAWTVDFFGLQKDDRFRLIYDQSDVDGELLSVDTIYFARFTRDTLDLYAVMFDQKDSGNVYWNEKGESMRKAFLKAPLQFKRISSGFSYARKHPVTGQVKAHTAVDYAAPTGTPVVALGDGTVISAGWAGGGGNTIKIRHNSVYTTGYLHLSRFASGIKAGVHVQQGQVIGYVGMTGTATGPHLDFRVWQNGTPINPLTLESPSAEPLKEEFRAQFDSTFRAYLVEMEGYGNS